MITFNEMPQAINSLQEDVKFIKELVLNKSKLEEPKQWLDINQLCEYLPHKPVKATIYALVHSGNIPNMKQGKKLIFSKQEIDIWLQSHKRKSKEEKQLEIENQADSFLSNKTKKGGANA